METTTAKWAGWAASAVRWLTGPIFDKEMRVSSRRRRNYVLRFVYIGLFTLVMTILWLDYVAHDTPPGSSSVYQVSRMASVGQAIITAVLWFQFLTSQAIAIVMLSTSISDEIYKRTLGTLMTTPIGSFQIVIGKLTSKLLQIVLLLAISLPLLAVARVFGGVPWGFLLCGLCVTLTSVVFVGSLSLFFSIFTRRAYTAIIESVLATALFFGIMPAIVLATLASFRGAPSTLLNRAMSVLSYVNPYMVMQTASISLYTARVTGFVGWPVHCAVMLGISLLLLLLAMIFVRRAALRQAVGAVADHGGWKTDDGGRHHFLSSVFRPRSSGIRRVVGPPVLWKERRIPLLGKRKVAQTIGAILILGLLALTYGLCAKGHMLQEYETHVTYTIVFFGVGLLFTTVLPATCITTERESQTWTLLLTTTVGTWEILGSKLAGAIRRCAPAWFLLLAHIIVFVAAGIVHPIALLQLALVAGWVVLFLASTGLYFSTRLRHTTTAVIANMALAAVLWALFPLFLALLLELTRSGDWPVKIYMDLNPFTQAGVVMSAAAHRGGLGSYRWMQAGMSSPADATGWIVLTCAAYTAAGLVFLALAAARLRREP